jgi:hypothetical protein
VLYLLIHDTILAFVFAAVVRFFSGTNFSATVVRGQECLRADALEWRLRGERGLPLRGSRSSVRLASSHLAAAVGQAVNAKEKSRETVEDLSEAEAAAALDYIARHRNGERDALGELLNSAPLDDEPTTPEEEEGLREAREQVARGEVISTEEIRREFA